MLLFQNNIYLTFPQNFDRFDNCSENISFSKNLTGLETRYKRSYIRLRDMTTGARKERLTARK